MIIDIMRIITVLAWSTLLALRFAEAKRVLFGEGEVGDMEGAIVAAFSFMAICYGLRWYIAADSILVHAGLYLFSLLLSGKLIAINLSTRMHRGD